MRSIGDRQDFLNILQKAPMLSFFGVVLVEGESNEVV
jgi:hypothetical protein